MCVAFGPRYESLKVGIQRLEKVTLMFRCSRFSTMDRDQGYQDLEAQVKLQASNVRLMKKVREAGGHAPR